MLTQIKKLVPLSIKRKIWAMKDVARRRYMTNDEVFSEVYDKNLWGGDKGELCSGPGSNSSSIVKPYIDIVAPLVKGKDVVDIGCGDMFIGGQLAPLCKSYVGLDVVPEVIEANKLKYANDKNTTFIAADIVQTDLIPQAQVCLIRQVLQHLSNKEILNVLQKLGCYNMVIVTEHYPLKPKAFNTDKVHGFDIRLDKGSGVYLDYPPFNVAKSCIKEILSVSDEEGTGVIKTFVMCMNQHFCPTCKSLKKFFRAEIPGIIVCVGCGTVFSEASFKFIEPFLENSI